ncbi:MAG: hypothetical protein GY808_08690 [Gammaproteobacteria bacterium]|nr:hypothetical protein [Gammaproteobacteria bacterium]
MKVWINRDKCETSLSACLSCFGEFVRSGVPNRGCITDHEDDGTNDLTIFMISEGQEREPIFIPEEARELVAYEGWDKFVSWEPEFRKNEGTRGQVVGQKDDE